MCAYKPLRENSANSSITTTYIYIYVCVCVCRKNKKKKILQVIFLKPMTRKLVLLAVHTDKARLVQVPSKDSSEMETSQLLIR